MGRRGPKPVHMGMLAMWEFEWFKALRLLRDGEQLPSKDRGLMDPEDADARIRVLGRLPLEKIVDEEPPPPDYQPTKPGDRASRAVWVWWAENQRQDEIARMRSLKPREIEAAAERRAIWDLLWTARSPKRLQSACDRWADLGDVQGLGFTAFPAHVAANQRQFLMITGSPRFPTSPAADDSRIDYVARGMAGVMVGVSPLTGIERLRNMSHSRGGPFWLDGADRCGCWRCNIEYWSAQEEVFAAHMEGLERDDDEA